MRQREENGGRNGGGTTQERFKPKRPTDAYRELSFSSLSFLFNILIFCVVIKVKWCVNGFLTFI